LAYADDIDVFVDSSSGAANDLPNVLFVIDNTANWSAAFNNEVAALAGVFNALEVNIDGSAKFRIGVMFASETGNPNSSVEGGYVRAAMRPMTATNKALYAAMITSLDVNKDKGNGGQSSLVMAEAYRYFSGGAPSSGKDKVKTDYAGNSTLAWSGSSSTAASRLAMQAIFDLGTNALPSFSGTAYNSPAGAGCAKNFIVYLSNGPSQDNNSITSAANTMLTTANGGQSISQFGLSPSGSQNNVSDEWAYFLKQRSSLAVTTYTIEVNRASSGQGPGWTALLNSMAAKSGGTYESASSAVANNISDAINHALSRIQGINTVFASVSLPVSVNTQGTYLNQVFVGMFRPEEGAMPRWAGNLKQYKLGMVNSSLKLVDATDTQAINTSTGFIQECARSFWTPSTNDSYWAFKPQGACIPTSTTQQSNSPDGNVVEKGGQGYLLRSATSRTMQTCAADFASCTSLTDFNNGNTAITETLLGAVSPLDRTALINWAAGVDVLDEDADANTTERRPSIHGDIVHSRPVALNFGTDTAPKVIVLYGGNDGAFRAINGNRVDAIGSTPAGAEFWSFMPPEFYSKIKRLRDNNTQISFPHVTGGQPKPYGMDGVITAYDEGSSKWIFGTMRRGGRAVYAFEANLDASDSLSMTLRWKRGCPNTINDTDCSTGFDGAGFDGIGQTWSAPKVFEATGSSNKLLIMGGGYDACEDSDPHTCTSASKGRHIYILNATDGTLLNRLDTDRGVIADIAVLTNAAGKAQYAYASDLGGNVYRINMTSGAANSWTIVKIASLGCSTTASCAGNRKFMFVPDVVTHNGLNYLLLGSGDREKPLSSSTNAYGTTNYFFMLKDKPTDSSWFSAETTNCADTLICLASMEPISVGTTPSLTNLDDKKGWYLSLNPHEQVVTTAITIYGTVTFSTHVPYVPTVGSCTSELGVTRLYETNYLGTSISRTNLPSVGLPPSPVAGMVTLDTGQTVPFCIGCSSDSPLEAEKPAVPATSTPTQPKNRVYWYISR
jgi:type IV pilus assembly protein PilY1